MTDHVPLEKFQNHARDHAGGDTRRERRRSRLSIRLGLTFRMMCVLKPGSVAEESSLSHERNLAHRLVGCPMADFSTKVSFHRERPLFSSPFIACTWSSSKRLSLGTRVGSVVDKLQSLVDKKMWDYFHEVQQYSR